MQTTQSQRKELALLLKDDISNFCRDIYTLHYEEYLQFLNEEALQGCKHALEELQMIQKNTKGIAV